MHIFGSYIIVSLIFILKFGADAILLGLEYDPITHKQVVGYNHVRRLRAATLKSDLKARSIERCLEHEIDLHYLDEETHQTPSQFSTRVRMSTRLPTLVLEQIEHHIEGINCFDSSIQLSFAGPTNMELVYKELFAEDDFFVITSHEGCNNDGAREPHRVSGVSLDEGERLITLHTSSSPWHDTIHFMTLDFGRSSVDFKPRRHGHLRPRQAGPSSTAITTAATSFTTPTLSPLISDITYPATSSSTPTSTFLSTSLTSATYISQTILPPDTNLGFHGPDIPHFFTLMCKNCSIYGSIEIFSGSLTTNLSDYSDALSATAGFWEDGGFVELLVNGLFAHIELETTLAPSIDLKTYTAHFPPIAFPLFQIEGIAAVGPQLIPQASMGVKLGTTLTFTYGFEVQVPSNSSITLVVGNITNSSITNFPDTTVSALPFQAEIDSIDLTLQAGFNPQLVLGATVFDNLGEIAAGAFLDLPSVSAALSYVTGVNASCDSVSSHDAVHGGLTNIVPSVVFDAGLFAEAAVGNGENYSLGEIKSYQFTNYTIPLSTVCLSFDPTASTFGPAINPATTTGPHGAKSTSAAVALNNPVARVARTVGWLVLVSLSFVLVSTLSTSL